MYLMGLDVGTTGVKAAVFSEDGGIAGYGFAEYGVDCPAPGHAEQHAEQVFAAALRVMALAAEPVGGDIAAIGLSVQGDAVIPVGGDGLPTAPAQLGMDYRCRAQADAFAREFGAEALFRRTGMAPHPLNSLCKIRHFVEEAPDIDAATRRYTTYTDYMLGRMGADGAFIDHTMATRTMGMDLTSLDWDDQLLRAAGIDRARLSQPVPSGTAVGTLRQALCETTGIRRGAKLVTGGHDQCCAALGAGVVKGDLALDSHGTAEVVSTALMGINTGAAMFRAGFPCYAHAAAGRYFTFSLNHTAGMALKWYVENFCEGDVARAAAEGTSAYDAVLARAEDRPSNLLVLPYLGGKGTPAWNLDASGLVVGLKLSTTRYEIARAILESLAFDMRENLAALRAAGMPIDALRCVGGGARSAMGLQLKADIAGVPVHTLCVREAACLGAAMLAGIACGAYRDAEQAAEIVRLDSAYLPREALRRRYDERFERYLSLYRANRALMEEMHQSAQ